MICHKIVLGLISFIICSSVIAQTVSYKTVVDLNSEESIYEANIRKIIQDKYKYKWIATQESAIRFDGKLLNRFSHSPNQVKYKLSGVDVWDIEEDTLKDEIFILTSYGDIDVLNTASASIKYRITRPANQENNWFMDMILVENNIWINSFKGLFVYKKNEKKFTEVLDYSKEGSGSVISKKIFLDQNKNIWAVDKTGNLYVYNSQDLKQVNVTINGNNPVLLYPELVINDIIQFSNSQTLIATNSGLFSFKFDNKYNIEIRQNPFSDNILHDQSVESLCLHNHTLFIAGTTIFVYDTLLKKVTELRDRNAFSSKNLFQSVQVLYYDISNMLWVGSRDGISYFNAGVTGLKSFYKDPESNFVLEHVFYVFPANDGLYYASTMNGLYSVSDDGKIKTVKKDGWFNYQFSIDGNNSIVSERNRLFVMKGGKLYNIEDVYPEFRNYSKFSLNSHIVCGDSMIIMGTENFKGVLAWNLKKKEVINMLADTQGSGMLSNVVNAVHKTHEDFAVVLSDKSLTKINLKNLRGKNYIITDIGSNEAIGTLFDILYSKGNYWIAAYGTGIIKTDEHFKIKKIYTTAEGLSNNGVYKIFQVYDSLIYITTNNGLNIFNIKTEKFNKYSIFNGLHSNTFEEACGVMLNTDILAGGVKGFTKIATDKIRANTAAPAVFISKLICEYPQGVVDSIDIMSHKFIINNDILQTSIYFSGINWSNPEHTTYTYRILEQGKEWINLNTQNFVTLIGLLPGTYHLEVKAANEDGIWSEPKELILVFLPKWYQTWWFKLLVFLATAGIIYAFYRYRIQQIKKQHQIRKNIATDLHDDLGSTLNSVKVFTNLAISGVKQEESLQQVKDNLTEATMSLRDMIWVLDDSLDTVDELITRLKQFAIPVAGASNIEAIIKADSEVNNRKLIKEEKRNLFLICKEAINNSIKYSGATQIHVTIAASGKKIQIVVADNGKGFNVDEVKKGYGLKNMQYRAGQIKYKVTLTSSLVNGTHITILPS